MNMLVDLKKLSAKELYELAQQKEQEEAKLGALQQQISEKETQRYQILSKQRSELAAIDSQIQELTLQRKNLEEKHAQTINALDEEVSTLKAEHQALSEANEKQNGQPAEEPIVTESKEYDEDMDAIDALLAASLEEDEDNEEDEITSAEIESTAPASGEESDEDVRLTKAIIETMRGRSYISDSLLREKLTAQGYAYRAIHTAINNMIKQKSVLRKGGGNYVLGKIPAALR